MSDATLTTDRRRAQIIERWENCQRVLENLPQHERDKHWNMAVYMEETACGTVCCAAGHCSMDPWFQSQGLKPTLADGYWYLPSDVSLDNFFGFKGSEEIFHNRTRRSVETVIEEVKRHIQYLKTAEVPT